MVTADMPHSHWPLIGHRTWTLASAWSLSPPGFQITAMTTFLWRAVPTFLSLASLQVSLLFYKTLKIIITCCVYIWGLEWKLDFKRVLKYSSKSILFVFMIFHTPKKVKIFNQNDNCIRFLTKPYGVNYMLKWISILWLRIIIHFNQETDKNLTHVTKC